jgi:hypothetical protein
VNFFTRDLYQRCRSAGAGQHRQQDELHSSLEEDVLDAACEEWERVNERYTQHLHALESRLPAHLREFASLLLHDARVLSVARQGNRLLMVLHKDIPPRDIVLLDYDLDGEPVLEPFAEAPSDWSRPTDFQFDELDVVAESPRPLYRQSVVFGNGWLMALCFHDVRVTLAQPLFSSVAGVAFPASDLSQTG